MEYKMMPVFQASDIRDAYNMVCSEEDEIESLLTVFWDGECCNDSYKDLYLEHDEFDDEDSDRNKVRAFLRGLYPHFDHILVDVSW